MQHPFRQSTGNPLDKGFHSIVVPLRVAAASARGYYLRGWRYSKVTDRMVAEAIGREQWSQAKWEEWQEERLAHMLRRASTSVPFFRQQMTIWFSRETVRAWYALFEARMRVWNGLGRNDRWAKKRNQ